MRSCTCRWADTEAWSAETAVPQKRKKRKRKRNRSDHSNRQLLQAAAQPDRPIKQFDRLSLYNSQLNLPMFYIVLQLRGSNESGHLPPKLVGHVATNPRGGRRTATSSDGHDRLRRSTREPRPPATTPRRRRSSRGEPALRQGAHGAHGGVLRARPGGIRHNSPDAHRAAIFFLKKEHAPDFIKEIGLQDPSLNEVHPQER